jgi:osmotically-inducible protein OsmY
MTDKEIQQAVLRELEWEPLVKSTDIGVSVKDGIVTLTGSVDSYTKKYAAEATAKRVAGVKAAVNDLGVKLPPNLVRIDEDIAREAVQALQSRTTVPADRIKVTVRNGWITLEGDVEWHYQKEAAMRAVRDLVGVKGVTNLITLKPRDSAVDVRAKIGEALKRTAELDAKNITVIAEDSKVILRETVHSLVERDEAERAAWSAPGVKEVVDQITVAP